MGGTVVAVELYDHGNDPGENFNLANKLDHRQTIEELRRALHAGWREALPGY
jgi:iduronate 2-sulfatase